jgi:2-dehydro-3-deoxyphosphogluconate aldolase / (4S)-4-hydroxy-2-oxoglutarate aldolase
MARDRRWTLHELERTGIIGVIRADGPEQLIDVCSALRDGGVVGCEITMTTPHALDAIARAHDKLGDTCIIGVGSVLDAETARAAILAGAQFVFAPTLDREVIAMAHRYDRVAVPGAMTPTEILSAWSAGADMVKIFPANHFGPQYIRDLHGPMPQLKLTPTGGVTLENAAKWIEAGAAALGVGSSLISKEFIRKREWKALSALAKKYIDIVAQTRQG